MNQAIKISVKIGNIIGVLALALIVGLSCVFVIYNEKLPEGNQSAEADALAHKMLKAVKHEAYTSTRYLEWTFAGQHHFKWDKQLQLVDVTWGENIVQLNIQRPEESTVMVNNSIVEDASKSQFVEKAIAYFNNDSFWLVAPHKIFDPGTERRIIQQENGEEALLVTYTSGGNTPGDSYLWLLDQSGLPRAFKLWVSIIPLGGIEATWEAWETTESGTLLPGQHNMLFLQLVMGDVKGWN